MEYTASIGGEKYDLTQLEEVNRLQTDLIAHKRRLLEEQKTQEELDVFHKNSSVLLKLLPKGFDAGEYFDASDDRSIAAFFQRKDDTVCAFFRSESSVSQTFAEKIYELSFPELYDVISNVKIGEELRAYHRVVMPDFFEDERRTRADLPDYEFVFWNLLYIEAVELMAEEHPLYMRAKSLINYPLTALFYAHARKSICNQLIKLHFVDSGFLKMGKTLYAKILSSGSSASILSVLERHNYPLTRKQLEAAVLNALVIRTGEVFLRLHGRYTITEDIVNVSLRSPKSSWVTPAATAALVKSGIVTFKWLNSRIPHFLRYTGGTNAEFKTSVAELIVQSDTASREQIIPTLTSSCIINSYWEALGYIVASLEESEDALLVGALFNSLRDLSASETTYRKLRESIKLFIEMNAFKNALESLDGAGYLMLFADSAQFRAFLRALPPDSRAFREQSISCRSFLLAHYSLEGGERTEMRANLELLIRSPLFKDPHELADVLITHKSDQALLKMLLESKSDYLSIECLITKGAPTLGIYKLLIDAWTPTDRANTLRICRHILIASKKSLLQLLLKKITPEDYRSLGMRENELYFLAKDLGSPYLDIIKANSDMDHLSEV